MSLKFDPWYEFRNRPQWHQPPAKSHRLHSLKREPRWVEHSMVRGRKA